MIFCFPFFILRHQRGLNSQKNSVPSEYQCYKTFHNSNFSRNIMVFLLIVIAISRNVKDRDKTARPRFKTLILTLHLKAQNKMRQKSQTQLQRQEEEEKRHACCWIRANSAGDMRLICSWAIFIKSGSIIPLNILDTQLKSKQPQHVKNEAWDDSQWWEGKGGCFCFCSIELEKVAEVKESFLVMCVLGNLRRRCCVGKLRNRGIVGKKRGRRGPIWRCRLPNLKRGKIKSKIGMEQECERTPNKQNKSRICVKSADEITLLPLTRFCCP